MPVRGADPLARTIGKRLGGRYEVTALIGVRPHGAAYRALDRLADAAAADRRTVTVTRLDVRWATGGPALDRVRELAAQARRLEHPSLDAPQEVVEAEGAAFVVSRYRPGRTLADLLGRAGGAGWPLRSVLPVGHRVADALEHAHAAGLAHGALDPSSVLLTAADEAVVTDFGLRCALDAGNPDSRDDVLGLARLVLAMLSGGGEANSQLPGRPGELREAAWSALLEGLASDPALRPASPAALIVALDDPGWFRRLVGRRSR